MSASYWIAKYVEDPFRNETRNIGVIVSLNGIIAARFVGERDDGVFDARKLKGFIYPNVYTQWREYWRKKANSRNLEAIVAASTPNFFVASGGEVDDTGSDTASDVCHFLFNLLVGKGVVEAFEWDASELPELDLATDITSALDQSSILANGAQLYTPHPVVRSESVSGRHVVHKPSYSQRNGRLYVMEHIDLSLTKINKVKERAGWMAYMFSDIKGFDQNAQAYSLIRPSRDEGVEQIEYAKSVLDGESIIVNWSDRQERDKFLQERKIVAGVAPPASTLNLLG